MATIQGFIFDLDGVLVDTARYHFQAWQRLAKQLGIHFTEKENEQLKGISRKESLQKILEWGNQTASDAEMELWMRQKNDWYLELINNMDSDEVLPGVAGFLENARNSGLKIALGSASRNARAILQKVQLEHYFHAIIDGNKTSRSKPDPQVFLMAAEELGEDPGQLVVFEDAQAGIEAAVAGGFHSVGIGEEENLKGADIVLPGFQDTSPAQLINQLNP
ncbi:MAG: beta-phosphoglucomutase [Owenweeksia sp.]|nr:beta-phosphoglucomutase [Owenweeksia sp.]MBF98007.1 beta-phosphoglucomutase [Owenweeksia sp.]HBF20981.1 beta-phosphoglucomutase [Cryomorphaceae bacterium]HCQ17469.1 beta-phosphoglucomutase [Cryomorphaceae bacterium]